jgi:hypothetical protein
MMPFYMKEPGKITGCIIRVTNLKEDVARALDAEFSGDCNCEVAPELSSSVTDKRHMFRMERMGNLDLEGWMHSFASDLEDMRSDGVMPNLGDSLRVSFELVYGGD